MNDLKAQALLKKEKKSKFLNITSVQGVRKFDDLVPTVLNTGETQCKNLCS